LIILWPTLWALFAATQTHLPSIKHLIIFVVGVVLMRTAGCVFNDILDKDFDFKVKRTSTRPITTGEVSVKSALTLGIILLVIAFILVLFLNLLTILLSFVALILALTYPLFKRFFALPQLALGLAFNFGVIMAYSAELNTVPTAAWLMYIACIFWTLSYDTMYALADKIYDQELGLHSSALSFGKHVTLAITICQTMMLIFLVSFAYTQSYNLIFYLALILCIYFFYYQYKLWKQDTIKDCISAFSHNHWVGLVIFIAILLQ
ncbi:4-hydroxybenzoate octaprenyltransferase, partial [Fangia hongkongensis]